MRRLAALGSGLRSGLGVWPPSRQRLAPPAGRTGLAWRAWRRTWALCANSREQSKDKPGPQEWAKAAGEGAEAKRLRALAPLQHHLGFAFFKRQSGEPRWFVLPGAVSAWAQHRSREPRQWPSNPWWWRD